MTRARVVVVVIASGAGVTVSTATVLEPFVGPLASMMGLGCGMLWMLFLAYQYDGGRAGSLRRALHRELRSPHRSPEHCTALVNAYTDASRLRSMPLAQRYPRLDPALSVASWPVTMLAAYVITPAANWLTRSLHQVMAGLINAMKSLTGLVRRR